MTQMTRLERMNWALQVAEEYYSEAWEAHGRSGEATWYQRQHWGTALEHAAQNCGLEYADLLEYSWQVASERNGDRGAPQFVEQA